jgi:hypothetical protein
MSAPVTRQENSTHRQACGCDACITKAIAALTYDEYHAMRELTPRKKAAQFHYLPFDAAVCRYDEETRHFYDTARNAVQERTK